MVAALIRSRKWRDAMAGAHGLQTLQSVFAATPAAYADLALQSQDSTYDALLIDLCRAVSCIQPHDADALHVLLLENLVGAHFFASSLAADLWQFVLGNAQPDVALRWLSVVADLLLDLPCDCNAYLQLGRALRKGLEACCSASTSCTS